MRVRAAGRAARPRSRGRRSRPRPISASLNRVELHGELVHRPDRPPPPRGRARSPRRRAGRRGEGRGATSPGAAATASRVALLQHRRKAEVADGEVEPERVVELAGDRARLLEACRSRRRSRRSRRASQPRLFRLSEIADHVAGLALERQDLLRGGTPRSGPVAVLARGERKQDLRALPRVGDPREKSPAPLERRFRGVRVTPLPSDPAEAGERHGLDEHVACGFARARDDSAKSSSAAVRSPWKNARRRRPAGGPSPIGVGEGARGECLVEPAASLGRAAPCLPVTADAALRSGAARARARARARAPSPRAGSAAPARRGRATPRRRVPASPASASPANRS